VQRLKTRPQFQAVLAGALIAKTAHFALHRLPLRSSISAANGEKIPGQTLLFSSHENWLGALVPKRWAKRAVTRNAIKRQVYTVALDFSGQFPNAVLVVRLRREFARSTFTSASSKLLKLAIRDEIQMLFESGVRIP
jgi:ribonuclease P protein component